MEVGLSLPIKMSSAEKEGYVAKAKQIGVSSIWVGDNPPINNAFLDIGRLIGNIEDINFWTGITSPFYYSVEVLFSLNVWLSRNYPNRFGLGLGIGNLNLIEDEKITRKPFSSFKKEVNQLLSITEIRKVKQGKEDFPSLAFGGLGKKMIKYAAERADHILLNSPSQYDVERALKIVEQSPSKKDKNFKIIPYGMLQIVDDEEKISTTMWNITKDIAKGSSSTILKSHGYSVEIIQKIRELSWDRYDEIPEGDVRQIIDDFGIIGTIDHVMEKMGYFKQLAKEKKIDTIVFGWIHTENQWDYIKQIVDFLNN